MTLPRNAALTVLMGFARAGEIKTVRSFYHKNCTKSGMYIKIYEVIRDDKMIAEGLIALTDYEFCISLIPKNKELMAFEYIKKL
jgi:hypothetical protein